MFLWFYSTAPPARYAVAAGLTAEEVGKGLGFGVHPLRLQKTASLLHPLSRIAEFCFRLLLRPRSSTCGLRRIRLFCSRKSLRASRLTPPLNMYWVGWGGAQAFYPKEDNAAGLLICDSHPVSNIILGLSRQPCKPARTARAGFGVIL